MTQMTRSAHPEKANELTESIYSQDGLLHVSRLVTVGELSTCFAHEVFNPLTMIRGHLHLLEEMISKSDPRHSHLEVIDRASRRIEDMAKRMLDFGRNRTAQMEYCDVSELLHDAAHFVDPYLHSHMVDVRIEVEPCVTQIAVYRWQILQAFVNLIQNAADAMAESAERRLTISARHEGANIRLTFADTGTGVPAENMERLFDAFFTTKGERGTGLGLYITRRIVEEHRGTITLRTSDSGATFTLILPEASGTEKLFNMT